MEDIIEEEPRVDTRNSLKYPFLPVETISKSFVPERSQSNRQSGLEGTIRLEPLNKPISSNEDALLAAFSLATAPKPSTAAATRDKATGQRRY